ncbi:MAG: hypothetical protein WAK82_13055 [Streptosporangiaceae bacterium]
MDLSPGQKKAVFAAVVLVLVALGLWLVVPKVTSSHASGTPTASPTPTATAPVPVTTITATATPSNASVSPDAAGNPNIYSWLPFTQQGLAAAAAVTVKFASAYNTFTYTESASAYVASMNGLITSQLAASLNNVYTTPGVASLRTQEKQTSTGSAVINSLRAFGNSSLTFVVAGTQHLVSSKGTSNGTTQYAITVTGSGTSWQVNDIELASAGNT